MLDYRSRATSYEVVSYFVNENHCTIYYGLDARPSTRTRGSSANPYRSYYVFKNVFQRTYVFANFHHICNVEIYSGLRIKAGDCQEIWIIEASQKSLVLLLGS